MRVPTIHLNGTSKERLLEALEEAYQAITAAQLKLSEAAPNGRDYYPQGPDVILEAVHEHNARVQKLEDVKKEIEHICEAIGA